MFEELLHEVMPTATVLFLVAGAVIIVLGFWLESKMMVYVGGVICAIGSAMGLTALFVSTLQGVLMAFQSVPERLSAFTALQFGEEKSVEDIVEPLLRAINTREMRYALAGLGMAVIVTALNWRVVEAIQSRRRLYLSRAWRFAPALASWVVAVALLALAIYSVLFWAGLGLPPQTPLP